MKKLGFGLMRLPTTDEKSSSVDVEQVKKMVDLFMEKGFTYFDTAIMYHGFASQRVAKAALVDRYPRNSFTLATKLHSAFFDSVEDRERVFSEQLEQTGAGYFDYYLLHCVDATSIQKYEKFDCFSWMLEKKAAGLIGHAGFSFHDGAELLDEVLTKHPETEFVQLQINYLDWESEWVQSRACYEIAKKHGKPIVVMEPVKGGTLASLPKEAEELFRAHSPDMSPSSFAIRFAASLDGVMTVLSGMSDTEQMKDNISYMENFTPLTEKEKELCFKAAEIMNSQTAIPCTSCSYCTEGCPMNIAIPQYFSLYNENTRKGFPSRGRRANIAKYKTLTETFGRAKDCMECGQCEAACPQHLQIIEHLKAVSEQFDEK